MSVGRQLDENDPLHGGELKAVKSLAWLEGCEYGEATSKKRIAVLEKAAGEMYKSLAEMVPAFNMSRIIMDSAEAREIAGEIVMRGRAALAEFDKAKEGK